MKKLLGLVFNRWVFGVIGVVAVCLLIWYVAPLIEIAKFAPFAPPWVREILIGITLLICFGKIVWKFAKAAICNRKLIQELAAGAPEHPKSPEPGSEELAALHKRFDEAINVLRGTRLTNRSKQSVIGSLSGRQYLYELPWYLIIGAPGSGKTTALLNAGLRFPLAQKLGREGIRGVGGTRLCDWWFTDEAVLLDTAGRFTTQDSNAEADRAGWIGFLGLLKKYRPRRPINGVLVTLSVADMLEASPQQRETLASRIRARIQELHEQIGIRFPIYVLLTKADLLPGFMEFFAELGREERAQVWGYTVPFTQDAQGVSALSAIERELAALEQRLNARLIARLENERDQQTRSAIYAFPQHFAALRRPLGELLNSIFAPSPFQEKPLVRGVYLTSGTQEGTPIDRLIGSMGRALGLARNAPASQRETGKSFFLTRLLRDVVFGEAGIAGTNLRWERKRVLLQWGGLTAAFIASVAMIAAWSLSYSRNKAYVGDIAQKSTSISTQVAGLSATGGNVIELLPVLESVRDLANASRIAGETIPVSMSFGLFQGDKLGAASQAAYQRLLRDTFAPRLIARIEQQLALRGGGNPELLYEALKTYVMLHDPQHFEAVAVRLFITADWESSLAQEITNEQRKQLAAHLDALLAGAGAVSPMQPDEALLASARAAVEQKPIAARVYNRLKRLEIGAAYPEFSFAREGGANAPLLLSRKSGQPLTAGVPGLYSYNGYHKGFMAASKQVARQLAEEAPWVLGATAKESATPLPGQERLMDDLHRLYLEDYARIWEVFVRDLQLIRPATLQQSIDTTRMLSSPTESPLPRLFRAIVREVTLAEVPEEKKSVIDRAAGRVEGGKDDLKKLLGLGSSTAEASGATLPKQIVDARFEVLRRLVTPPAGGQPAPIDSAAPLMNELYIWLGAAQVAIDGKTSPPVTDIVNKVKSEGARLPEPLSGILTELSRSAETLVASGGRGIIDTDLTALVYDPCSKAVQGRYPFSRAATEEVTMDDFARVFSPGGLIDDFFQKRLVPVVDIGTRPWSFRKIGNAMTGGNPAVLTQFQRAQAIREVFFRGGATPRIRLDFKPLEMDASITQFILDVDGQIVRYSHGPTVTTAVQWPGPSGRQQVRVELSPPASAGASSGLSAQGPWALFRLFERMQMQPTAQPERFLVTFAVDGRRAQFEVTTASVQNPFRLKELAEFQCPRRFSS